MYSSVRLSIGSLGLVAGLSLVAIGSGDSPIMDLDDVIGVEIQRVSLGQTAMETGRSGELVVDAEDPADFDLVRRFDHRLVNNTSIQVRTNKGAWVDAMIAAPKGVRSPPAVFLLDEAFAHLKPQGLIPEELNLVEFDGRVSSRAPLGSHLIGSGYALGFPTPVTLSRHAGSMTSKDWIRLIDRFRKKANVEPENLFIVATHEHAELALRLLAKMDFAGAVIESPREMMFTEEAAKMEVYHQGSSLKDTGVAGNRSQTDGDFGAKVVKNTGYYDSEYHMIQYAERARSVKGPLLLMLAKDAPDYDQTREILLASLVATKADFSVVLLERWSRTLLKPEEQATKQTEFREASEAGLRPGRPGEPVPGPFHYELDEFQRWITQMEVFLYSRSKTKPLPLPAPMPGLRQRPDTTIDEVNRLDSLEGSMRIGPTVHQDIP